MWIKVFLLLVAATALSLQDGFEVIEPTNGKVWPLPHMQNDGTGYFLVDPATFLFNATVNDCQIMQDAFTRYLDIIKAPFIPSKRNSKAGKYGKGEGSTLHALDVKLLKECESYPYLNMYEQYELKICTDQYPDKAELISNSIWGILRGMETFTQLIKEDFKTGDMTINCAQIMDFPRFPHRGLLLDTSRHYLPIEMLQQNIDLLSMNKFNTFHWHIVDDQSFPYESAVYPKLSDKGSWSAIHTYSASDVQGIIDYGRDRGIRVVPEYDTPGHVRSWGNGEPGLLTQCYEDGVPNGKLGPIDPSKEETYTFMYNFFTEIVDRFEDNYIHLGGDEVEFDCWESNPKITEFMIEEGISDYKKLEEYYFNRLLAIIESISSQTKYLVWEEVFDNNVTIKSDTLVHVWKYENDPSQYYPELKKVVSAGHQALLSSCWYLNYISYGVDWHKFYDCDPHGFGGTPDENLLVLGGEAAMWGEWVDKTNVISRTWPRASPVAERLWSDLDSTLSADAAAPRLEEHRCRLLRRGYNVEPLGISYCEGIL